MISKELHPKINAHLQVIGFSPVIDISRLISRVFRPFLSQRRLIFRRLQRKRGLNDSRKAAKKAVLPQIDGSFGPAIIKREEISDDAGMALAMDDFANLPGGLAMRADELED